MEDEPRSDTIRDKSVIRRFQSLIHNGGIAMMKRLQKEMDQLLHHHSHKRADWAHDTHLWKICERMHIWQQLDDMMLHIMKEFASQSLELRAI